MRTTQVCLLACSADSLVYKYIDAQDSDGRPTDSSGFHDAKILSVVSSQFGTPESVDVLTGSVHEYRDQEALQNNPLLHFTESEKPSTASLLRKEPRSTAREQGGLQTS